MSSPKYNRTPHLPWSPGKGSDDKVAKDLSSLLGQPIVITEKMDGSNTSLENDGCYARTHAGPPTHKSFDGLKALHASIQYDIPKNHQYFGEWLYAKHSIHYTRLPAHFLMFAARFIDNGMWANWSWVADRAEEMGLVTVPVLWTGIVKNERELEELTISLASRASYCGGEREGVVVRLYDSFPDELFSNHVMKYVRENHVQTTEHWKDQEIIRNILI